MTARFRLVAGPNGSGKSTLMRWLRAAYAVNFYDVLNADDIFEEVRQSLSYSPQFPIDGYALCAWAETTSYDESVKSFFRSQAIRVEDDCIRFASQESVNSYTIALITNFLQACCIRLGRSFSQETVFSHPSKIEALAAAQAAGFRNYLYFVATDSPRINLSRVDNRVRQGGHAVPIDKIIARFNRSLGQVRQAKPYLWRAFFFDNSSEHMRYLGQWNKRDGWRLVEKEDSNPKWFKELKGEF